MRLKLGELLAKLYVFRSLSHYESEQWSVYSDDAKATCSAEVRLDGYEDDVDMLEAQIIISYDAPRPSMPAMVQTAYIKAKRQKQGDFAVDACQINGKEMTRSGIFDWGKKSCKFFMLAAQELEKGNLPDFEELEKIAFDERGRFGDKWGDGGGKSPNVNTEKLLKAQRGF